MRIADWKKRALSQSRSAEEGAAPREDGALWGGLFFVDKNHNVGLLLYPDGNHEQSVMADFP